MNPNSSKLSLAYARGLEKGKLLRLSDQAGLAGSYWHDAARCLAKLPGWPKEKVVAEVRQYHQERLDAVPALLVPGLRIVGPAIVEEPTTTLVIM